MKKNISINISGIIFHIEEDGYARLKDYLETINNYFSTYEDSQEIIEDIESRVAEIFLAKLDDGKQVIHADDVNALIETMGTVADFEAVEDMDSMTYEEAPKSKGNTEEPSEEDDKGKRKLMRDEKRSVLGGVAAGMAYYFSVDPLWIRVLLVAFLLNVIVIPVSGFVFISYIILWVILPGSKTLGDQEHVKKMFRDGDNKVIGGVSSGLAAYFGIDVTLVRLLLVLSIFLGGTGIILYIIFWMITPEANSITEKMQMQGEPVTLSNIEQTVKSSLLREEGEESPLAKVLLFPFRMIAVIFGTLAKLLGPFSKIILEVVRVIAGLAIGLTGLMGMISIFMLSGVVMGVFSGAADWLVISDFPVGLAFESVSGPLFLALFILGMIPFLVIALIGLSVLLKRMVINAAMGWAIFGIWVICLISLSFTVPKMWSDFSHEGSVNQTKTFTFDKSSPVFLRLLDESNLDIDLTKLRIRGHQDSVFTLMMKIESRGRSRQDAEDNAQMIRYDVQQNNNVLTFDSNYTFKDKSKFRGQTLSMTLYVPYGQVFVLGGDMGSIVRNTINRSGYKNWHIDESNKWMFSEEGLKCLTCSDKYGNISKRKKKSSYRSTKKKSSQPDYSDMSATVFDLADFSQIDVRGFYNVYITQGESYNVMVKGREKFKKDVVIKKFGSVLEISMSKKKWNLFKDLDDDYRVGVFITMPNLDRLSSSGFSHFEIDELNVEDLEIDFSGAASANMQVDVERLTIYMSGASSLNISGDTREMDVDISSASSLKAYELNAENMDVEASGASNARLNVSNSLSVDASGLSTIRYKGNPRLDIRDQDELTTIKRTD